MTRARIDLEAVAMGIETLSNELYQIVGDKPDKAIAVGVGAGLAQAFVDMAVSLRQIAQAQIDLVAIANADLTQIVNDAIKKGVDEGVQAAKNERSPIGRQPNG